MAESDCLSDKKRIAVSSCLVGKRCRFDGAHKYHSRLAAVLSEFVKGGGEIISVCPEELGGLGTPRPAAVLHGGDGEAVWHGTASVIQPETQTDVTALFKTGASRALEQANNCELAILKERSPSCGVRFFWSEAQLVEGRGVFAALLAEHGMVLESEMTLFGGSDGQMDGE